MFSGTACTFPPSRGFPILHHRYIYPFLGQTRSNLTVLPSGFYILVLWWIPLLLLLVTMIFLRVGPGAVAGERSRGRGHLDISTSI